MGCSDFEKFDWASFLGEGDLADFIAVKEADEAASANLRNVIDDFYFQQGLVGQPRGPIELEGGTVSPPEPTGPIQQPPPPVGGDQPPAGGGQVPPAGQFPPGAPPVGGGLKPRVIPCDNVIIDESDGANGRPLNPIPGPGMGGRPAAPRIIEIPPRLANCVFTQHHHTDNGIGWTVIIRIKNGRMKQVIVTFEQGQAVPLSVNVGDIIKVHKDNNKITVVGKKRVCAYYVKTSRLLCIPPL